MFTSAEIRQEAELGQVVPAQPDEDGVMPSPGSRFPTTPQYSLLPLLVGTLKATLIAVLVAIPLAIGAALVHLGVRARLCAGSHQARD